MSKLGSLGFVLFYLAALVVAIMPTISKTKEQSSYSSLGASGAVSAVIFSYILMNPWSTLLLFVIPVPAIVFAVAYVAYSVWADGQGRQYQSFGTFGRWYFGMLATIAIEPGIVAHFLTN